MGTPKKSDKSKPTANKTGAKKSADVVDPKAKKRVLDDDDDFEDDMPLDELDYDNFGDYEDDDDF